MTSAIWARRCRRAIVGQTMEMIMEDLEATAREHDENGAPGMFESSFVLHFWRSLTFVT
jgi:hypothetical protein